MSYGPQHLQSFLKKHEEVIARIVDLFTELAISPEEGEGICLCIAGLSAGNRQFPILEEFPEVPAMAWQMGAQGIDNV